MQQTVLPMDIILRPTTPDDLDTLFDLQADDEAGYQAAFVSNTWKDREGYKAKWEKLLKDPGVTSNTILYNGEIAGSVGIYLMDGEPQITYGVDRSLWGKGIGKKAVGTLLTLYPNRPLYARVAFDNVASMRLLEYAGFSRTGEDRHFAAARNAEIQEIIFVLRN